MAEQHDRVANAADALREALSSLFDTSLALADVRLNQIMKKLTGWAAIIAVPTLITSFVGMNVISIGRISPRFLDLPRAHDHRGPGPVRPFPSQGLDLTSLRRCHPSGVLHWRDDCALHRDLLAAGTGPESTRLAADPPRRPVSMAASSS